MPAIVDPALRVLRELGLEVGNGSSLSYLHRAVLLGTPSVELKKYLPDLNSQDDHGRTPLRYAIEMGSLETCKELVELGANVDLPDRLNIYPAHSACSRGDGEVLDLLWRRTLVPNAVDSVRGETCLVTACRYRNWELVPTLNRVDLTKADSQGKTPLHWLVANMQSATDCLEVVEFLVANRANVNALDSQGLAPLHLAASRGLVDMIQVLTKAGAQVNLAGSEGVGNTPLHLAVSKPSLLQGKSNAMTALIELKADVSAKRRGDGATALDVVVHLQNSRMWNDGQSLALEVAARKLKKAAEDLHRA
ncbi:hypothetical protein BASA81_007293 [Batrachochytrium salamandrivorans]|nr:hypothetical protein BASA81_007293 [Batrachochytrium salamandrivorans]